MPKIFFKKNKCYLLLNLFLFFFLLVPNFSLAQTDFGDLPISTTTLEVSDVTDLADDFFDSEPDAIAIRVLPNPENYNIQQWYRMQGFTGSPQSLIVDGYKAIRDGRSVYISAANIDTENNKIYFNIYLISYNQEADNNTIDIFGKILNTWKLNTNLKTYIGHCTISNKVCENNSDCSNGYICGGFSDLPADEIDINSLGRVYQKNRCIIKEDDYSQTPSKTPACFLDSECPNNLFCDSPKAKLIRDMDRLEKFSLIRNRLEAYKELNGHYPILASGTYMPHMAISSWPSWQRTFLSQINTSGLSDNINRINSCYDEKNNFDLITCWEDSKSAFLNVEKPINYTNFILPKYSSVFAYVSDPAGKTANLYCPIESSDYWGVDFDLPTGENTSNFKPPLVFEEIDEGDGEGELPPQYIGPYFEDFSLSGHSGQEFEGYIRAKDPQNQELTWYVSDCFPGKPLHPSGAIVNNCSDFSWSSWEPAEYPAKENSNSSELIYLLADRAGEAQEIKSDSVIAKLKTYVIGVSVKNTSGHEIFKNFPITISNQNPNIQVNSNYNQDLSLYQDFSFPILISDISGLESISLCHLDSSNNCLNTWNLDPEILSEKIDFTGSSLFNDKLIMEFTSSGNNYSLKIKNKYFLDTPNVFNSSHLGVHKFKITAQDPYSAQTSKIFNITFTADQEPGVMFFNCPPSIALGNFYSCQVSPNNPSGNISFEILEKPDFLSFDSVNKIFSGTANSSGHQKIKLKITNGFGVSSEGSYNFNVYIESAILDG